MKPTATLFALAMESMGVRPMDTVYVYAMDNCAFVHRAYWTFAYTGYHDPRKVKLVQGSLEEWDRWGGPLDRRVLLLPPNHNHHSSEDGGGEDGDLRIFQAQNNKVISSSLCPKYVPWMDRGHGDGSGSDESVSDSHHVLAIVKDIPKCNTANRTIIIDARSAGRFYGREPEPRSGLRGGHIPGSINVPFLSLLDPTDVTKFRPMEEVRTIFVKAGVLPLVSGDRNDDTDDDSGGNSSSRKIICTCGSGVTAATLAVGLVESGLRAREDVSIYDGSWIDWGGREDTPIATE